MYMPTQPAKSLVALGESIHPNRKPLEVREPTNKVRRKSASAIEHLQELIDLERENLARLDSLLGCLIIAMEYGSGVENPPHHPDVAQMARDLVRQSMRRLDPLAIERSMHEQIAERAELYSNVSASQETDLTPTQCGYD